MPAVSVVTATYNRAHILPRAIESVREQTLRDWEHIIVDDESTDNTTAVVEPYLKADARLRYFRQRNGGPASAMNAGIRRARSEFVAFLDCDDEFTPKHLALRLQYFAAHPEIDMVWGGTRVTGPRARQYVADVADPKRRLHFSRCRVSGSFVVRRSVLREVRGFRQMFSLDYDLCQRVQAAGAYVAEVDFRTFIYHVEEDDRMTLRKPPHLSGYRS